MMINQEISNAVVQEIKSTLTNELEKRLQQSKNLLLLNQLMNFRHFQAQLQPPKSQNV